MVSNLHLPRACMFFSASISKMPSSPTRRTSLPALRSASNRMPKFRPAFWNTSAVLRVTSASVGLYEA